MRLPIAPDPILLICRRVLLLGALAAAFVTANHGQAREPDTVYDWSALQAAVAKRVAAEPCYPAYLSEANKQNGPKKNKWSKGSPWTVTDIIAALKRGASADEIVEVIDPDFDGATLDRPAMFVLQISPEWKAALARRKIGDDPINFKLLVNLSGMDAGRSRFADELAREVIARRQRDLIRKEQTC